MSLKFLRPLVDMAITVEEHIEPFQKAPIDLFHQGNHKF